MFASALFIVIERKQAEDAKLEAEKQRIADEKKRKKQEKRQAQKARKQNTPERQEQQSESMISYTIRRLVTITTYNMIKSSR